MKCMFYISMYSGSIPPECELDLEQTEKINELVAGLHIKYEHKGPAPLWGLGSLSPTIYGVFWRNDFLPGDPDIFTKPFEESPWMGFQCQSPGGPVHIYRQEEDFRGVDLRDTVGLWEYLSIISAKLYARHCRDAAEAISQYYEEMSRISEQKKV